MSGIYWDPSPEPDDVETRLYKDRNEEYALCMDRRRDERWERIWEARPVKPSAVEPVAPGSVGDGEERVRAPESAAEEHNKEAA